MFLTTRLRIELDPSTMLSHIDNSPSSRASEANTDAMMMMTMMMMMIMMTSLVPFVRLSLVLFVRHVQRFAADPSFTTLRLYASNKI